MQTPNEESLKAEVWQAVAALELIASADHPVTTFGDSYKHVGINFTLPACEIAAKMTGRDPFFCKMLNYKFRTDAAELMFEHALAEVAQ